MSTQPDSIPDINQIRAWLSQQMQEARVKAEHDRKQLRDMARAATTKIERPPESQ